MLLTEDISVVQYLYAHFQDFFAVVAVTADKKILLSGRWSKTVAPHRPLHKFQEHPEALLFLLSCISRP